LAQIVRLKRPPKQPQRSQRPPGPPRRPVLGPWLYIVALVLIVALGQRLSGPVQNQTSADDGEDIVAAANAIRVADGDSLDVARLRIRLYGIDAPELVQQCGDQGGRAYDCGRTAARALEDLIGNKMIRCARRGIDQYERILAVCTAGNVDLNAAMVESGHAVAYRENSSNYIVNEQHAKAARRGLWAGSFKMPQAYRRDNGDAR